MLLNAPPNSDLTSRRLNARQFVRDGSGPGVVCIQNDRRVISCALSEGQGGDSPEEYRRTGSERASTADTETMVVSIFFVHGHRPGARRSCRCSVQGRRRRAVRRMIGAQATQGGVCVQARAPTRQASRIGRSIEEGNRDRLRVSGRV